MFAPSILLRTASPMILTEAMDSRVANLRLRSISHHQFATTEWYFMLGVAFILLCVCFLIAGLTLGVCGLDQRLLEMRSLTGTLKQRKQAMVILRMKRHQSWMLCSLIICSVASGEYFPFVVEALCGVNEKWIPIVISTLLLAVCAEIIPQWLIPRYAISWGYYCWPLIWGCMWLTAMISYPIAWLLDGLGARRKDELGVFTNEQLAVIIKQHEKSERRGGDLSSDASRIIVSVLNNDGREIGCETARVPQRSEDSSKDVEKGSADMTQGMIVRWSAVKTVDMNEIVDKAFIRKVLAWSYSRIPVVSKQQVNNDNSNSGRRSERDGAQIFGFLHIKNLVGIDTTNCASSPMFVRDLPLYPLPIITDEMTVYELLCIFQLGMSRIAIVVPALSCLGNAMQHSSIRGPTFWTGTNRTNTKIASKMADRNMIADLEVGYTAAKFYGQHVTGVRTPKPIGIITFEDIIDALLQKTSHDEKDFFDRKTSFPPTNLRKAGDARPSLLNVRHATTLRGSEILLGTTQQIRNDGFRRRYVLNPNSVPGIDGVEERSLDNFDLQSMSRKRENLGSSSYTDNSQGGFHYGKSLASRDMCPGPKSLTMSIFPIISITPTSLCDVVEGADQYSKDNNDVTQPHIVSATFPGRRPSIAITTRQNTRRNFSASPCLPERLSSFSRQTFSSFESSYSKDPKSASVTPTRSNVRTNHVSDHASEPLNSTNQYINLSSQEVTGDTISLSSWGSNSLQTPFYNADTVSEIVDIQDFFIGQSALAQNESLNARNPTGSLIIHATRDIPRPEPYTGFPPELLDSNKESRDSTYASKTMPRTTKPLDESVGYCSGRDNILQKQGLHNDRTRLPNQRRPLVENVLHGGDNHRTTSLWF